MKLDNPFSTETRWLFHDYQECWVCGKNGNAGLELHHITGRGSSSPFNAAVLCKECHAPGMHTLEEEKQLFTKTYILLIETGYRPTDDDWAFISKFMERYPPPPDAIRHALQEGFEETFKTWLQENLH